MDRSIRPSSVPTCAVRRLDDYRPRETRGGHPGGRRSRLENALPRPSRLLRSAPTSKGPKTPPPSARAYPRLMRTIVSCGVAVASLLACSTAEPSERPMPRPTAAPVVIPPVSALDPAPAAKTVGLLLNEPEAFGGYTLFNKRGSRTIYLIDNQGRVVHRWELDDDVLFARLLENGNLLTFPRQSFDEPGRHVTEVDRNGNILWECTQGILHHDVLKMPNGNLLLLLRQHKTAEEAIAAGANPDFIDTDGLMAPHIVEVEPTGPANCEIVWEWSAWDHLIQDFDSSKANHGVVAEHPELIDLNFRLSEVLGRFPSDWIHSNGIDYNPELDQILLSPRHFSEVWTRLLHKRATNIVKRRRSVLREPAGVLFRAFRCCSWRGPICRRGESCARRVG